MVEISLSASCKASLGREALATASPRIWRGPGVGDCPGLLDTGVFYSRQRAKCQLPFGDAPTRESFDVPVDTAAQALAADNALDRLYASLGRRLADIQRNRGIEQGTYTIDPSTAEE